MNIKISAIICTLNRANYLRKALQSLVEQTLDTNEYEILVVDNHSTDETKSVVTEEFSHISNLRYLYEPVLGLSQARNTGWQNAQGKYVAYLDDDAIAYSYWLEKILQVFETMTPQPGCVGGKVQPIWEAEKPHWLPDKLLPYLTVLNWSDVPVTLEGKMYIAGANMVFPKYLLEKIGGFQVSLGRTGGKLLSNEETFLQNQLKNIGYSIYYDPDITVKHHVAASRLTQNWFIKRLYWQGISEASLWTYQESPSYLQRIHLALIETKKMLKSPKHLASLIIPTNDANIFQIKCLTFKQIGYISGLLNFTNKK
jgi:glucosyl-dolichyl phosphate glucuronosyltransferase